jgi:hypothetical protein
MMARQASKGGVALAPDAPLDAEVILSQQNQVAVLSAEHDSQVRAVAEQLGYQLPADCTDPDLIQRDIAANMRRSVEACLEVGRGLQVLKTACGHGNFIDRLDALGIDRHVAKRFIAAAVKFSSLPASSALTKAIGSQSKLIEMLVLDDGELQELELTGQTGELTLDDVATMSVKELRKALREAREDKKALQQVAASKNDKIDELSAQLAKKPLVIVLPPDQEAKQLRQEVAALAFEAEADITGKLREGFAKLQQHGESTGVDHASWKAGLVAHLERMLQALKSEFHLPEVDAGSGIEQFPWLNGQGDA